MRDGFLLLKTLLLSTSQRNIYRYCRDKKKRRKVVGNAVAMTFLYVMLIAYSLALSCGLGVYGMIDAAPAMCAISVSAIALLFTLFQTNGYLFNFRDYDMLLSLPFKTGTVAACRYMYMYIRDIPWYMCISLAMMIGYGIFARPSVIVYPLWIVLSLFLPIVPSLAAALIGFLVAKLTAGHKKTKLLQTVLMFVFLIACFSSRFFIDSLFRDDKVQETFEKTSAMSGRIAGIYLPAGWFSDAVTRLDIGSILLLVGTAAVLFAAVFSLVGRSYRSINSALKTQGAARRPRLSGQRRRGVVTAIAFKEFRRLTGSTTYMTNAAMGIVLAALLGVVTLVFGFDKIIAVVTKDAPLDAAMLRPAIPFIVYFFIGMVATTACSPSLEGKCFWILQSLPVEMKTVYQGKMLFNMLLTVPFMAFSTLCLCVSAKAPALDTALDLLLGFALCAFSTAWGCVCGVKHIQLDWENEVEVLKQSPAVVIYMLPNMFVVMGLVVLAVFLGTRVDHRLLTLLWTLIASVLALLSYRRVLKLSVRRV